MTATQHIITMEAITCCHEGCGLVFGIEAAYEKRLRETHTFFTCPNGHSQHFTGETEAQRLRRNLEYAERRLANVKDDLNVEKASHRSTRMQLGKVKKRVLHGTCPVQGCHRTFANLQRHIETVHPAQLADQK